MDGRTDPGILAAEYATAEALSMRQDIYRWQVPRLDLPRIICEELAEADGPVLDVGCGNGRYVRELGMRRPELTVVALDRSAGMLRELLYGARLQADAAALPIGDQRFGAALAMHMLYHVPDPQRAVAELRRVVRPGGTVLASTNSRDDKWEFDLLLASACKDVFGRSVDLPRVAPSTFTLEDAPRLFGKSFDIVRQRRLRTELEIPYAWAVTDYLASMRASLEKALGGDVDAVLERAKVLAREAIDRSGRFLVTCVTGYIIAL